MMGGGLGGGSSPMGGMAAGMLAGGSSGIAQMAMTMVYPNLKPMLEASIRKVTVSVEWPEGSKTRNVEAVQYVTNPQQGGIDKNAAQGLDQQISNIGSALGIPGMTGAGPGTGTGTGTGTR